MVVVHEETYKNNTHIIYYLLYGSETMFNKKKKKNNDFLTFSGGVVQGMSTAYIWLVSCNTIQQKKNTNRQKTKNDKKI